jgi:hypothetical protein
MTLIEILPQLSKDEIPQDSTRFHEIPPQSSKDDPDDKDNPNNKDDPNNKIPSQFLLNLSVK